MTDLKKLAEDMRRINGGNAAETTDAERAEHQALLDRLRAADAAAWESHRLDRIRAARRRLIARDWTAARRRPPRPGGRRPRPRPGHNITGHNITGHNITGHNITGPMVTSEVPQNRNFTGHNITGHNITGPMWTSEVPLNWTSDVPILQGCYSRKKLGSPPHSGLL